MTISNLVKFYAPPYYPHQPKSPYRFARLGLNTALGGTGSKLAMWDGVRFAIFTSILVPRHPSPTHIIILKARAKRAESAGSPAKTAGSVVQ
ncbi:hypothetical protein FRC08_005188 [Ceratobasidium sp. 394]|nr:hypothetical protein FRC08_005188 [Ceratobasidium sp. 394]